MAVPEPVDICLLDLPTAKFITRVSDCILVSVCVCVCAKSVGPNLEPWVCHMWMFEGQKFSTKQTFVVVNCLINLKETKSKKKKIESIEHEHKFLGHFS